MTGRREFLIAAVGVGARGGNKKERSGYAGAVVAAARQIVRRGELGAIHFCRIAHPGLRNAASCILDCADCVIEIEPDAEGAAFLGSRGTLVVSGGAWRVFAQE
jgi:hypothetical protein